MSKKRLLVNFIEEKVENSSAINNIILELEIPERLRRKKLWKKIKDEKIFWEEYMFKYYQSHNRRHKRRSNDHYSFNIKSWAVSAATRAVESLKKRNGRIVFTKVFINSANCLIMWGFIAPGEFDIIETKSTLYQVIF